MPVSTTPLDSSNALNLYLNLVFNLQATNGNLPSGAVYGRFNSYPSLQTMINGTWPSSAPALNNISKSWLIEPPNNQPNQLWGSNDHEPGEDKFIPVLRVQSGSHNNTATNFNVQVSGQIDNSTMTYITSNAIRITAVLARAQNHKGQTYASPFAVSGAPNSNAIATVMDMFYSPQNQASPWILSCGQPVYNSGDVTTGKVDRYTFNVGVSVWVTYNNQVCVYTFGHDPQFDVSM